MITVCVGEYVLYIWYQTIRVIMKLTSFTQQYIMKIFDFTTYRSISFYLTTKLYLHTNKMFLVYVITNNSAMNSLYM